MTTVTTASTRHLQSLDLELWAERDQLEATLPDDGAGDRSRPPRSQPWPTRSADSSRSFKASPVDRAAVYKEVRLRLGYHPEKRQVTAAVDFARVGRGLWVSEGGLGTKSPARQNSMSWMFAWRSGYGRWGTLPDWARGCRTMPHSAGSNRCRPGHPPQPPSGSVVGQACPAGQAGPRARMLCGVQRDEHQRRGRRPCCVRPAYRHIVEMSADTPPRSLLDSGCDLHRMRCEVVEKRTNPADPVLEGVRASPLLDLFE